MDGGDSGGESLGESGPTEGRNNGHSASVGAVVCFRGKVIFSMYMCMCIQDRTAGQITLKITVAIGRRLADISGNACEVSVIVLKMLRQARHFRSQHSNPSIHPHIRAHTKRDHLLGSIRYVLSSIAPRTNHYASPNPQTSLSIRSLDSLPSSMHPFYQHNFLRPCHEEEAQSH